MSKCRIDNKYYKSTLYTSMIYYAATGTYSKGPIYHFRIIAPKAADQFVYVPVYSYYFLLSNVL